MRFGRTMLCWRIAGEMRIKPSLERWPKRIGIIKKASAKVTLELIFTFLNENGVRKDVGKKPDYTEGDERKAVGRKDLVEASPVVMDRGT